MFWIEAEQDLHYIFKGLLWVLRCSKCLLQYLSWKAMLFKQIRHGGSWEVVALLLKECPGIRCRVSKRRIKKLSKCVARVVMIAFVELEDIPWESCLVSANRRGRIRNFILNKHLSCLLEIQALVSCRYNNSKLASMGKVWLEHLALEHLRLL